MTGGWTWLWFVTWWINSPSSGCIALQRGHGNVPVSSSQCTSNVCANTACTSECLQLKTVNNRDI